MIISLKNRDKLKAIAGIKNYDNYDKALEFVLDHVEITSEIKFIKPTTE